MKFKKFIISTVLLSFSSLHAQMWDWAKGGGADDGASICLDRVGGLYVASKRSCTSFMGTTMTYTECGEVISHHDLQGNLLWAQKIVAGDIAAITADRSGNCYATGSCYSATFHGAQGDIIVNHPGDSQAFIVKYDYNGNILWVKTWDYPGLNDGGLGIKSDDFGNIIVTGLDSKTFWQGGPSSNFFMLKYDTQGVLLWSRESNWRGTFTCGSIELDEQDNIYVAGTFIDSAVFSNATLISNSGQSIGLAKYDKNGNLLWAKKLGNGFDNAGGIALDHKGHFYFTGSFYTQTNFGNVTITSPSQLGSCIFIAKFDTTANCIWARTSQKRGGVALAVDTTGNCYVALSVIDAVSFGSGTNSATFSGPKSHQFVIVKYDQGGNFLWGACPGGSNYGDNSVRSICTDIAGRCYLTGVCEQTNFGLNTLTTTGVFIARLSPLPIITPGTGSASIISSVNENVKDQNSFSVYPNPTSGQVFVSFLNSNGLKNIGLQIKDVIGQSICEKSYNVNANEFIQEIDLGHLPKGIYFIEVVADKAREVRRIIVE